MARPTMISATITSISVNPRSATRIAETLLALLVFGRLGLLDQEPVAVLLALLDAQVAVGERGHAPQRRRGIALDLQLERHDVAARQDRELRRPLLVLVFLGAVRQAGLEHQLAAFQPNAQAQSLGQRARRVEIVVGDLAPLVVARV